MFITWFHWQDDERCVIRVEGEEVFRMSHDLHGWDGMEGIRDAVIAVTQAAGGTVVTTGGPGV
jgi:hypothetical protein